MHAVLAASGGVGATGPSRVQAARLVVRSAAGVGASAAFRFPTRLSDGDISFRSSRSCYCRCAAWLRSWLPQDPSKVVTSTLIACAFCGLIREATEYPRGWQGHLHEPRATTAQ